MVDDSNSWGKTAEAIWHAVALISSLCITCSNRRRSLSSALKKAHINHAGPSPLLHHTNTKPSGKQRLPLINPLVSHIISQSPRPEEIHTNTAPQDPPGDPKCPNQLTSTPILSAMAHSKLLSFLFLLALPMLLPPSHGAPNSNLFREYIGAEFKGVKFSDVPVDPGVEFHFILSFAIDYTADGSSPTDGRFNVFWDADNLGPSEVADVKRRHGNVKVAFSLGGDSVGNGYAYFDPSSIESWVTNAVSSLRQIVEQYGLDGLDVDYEHFKADPDTFAECVGRLITTLKRDGVISFASIAPFDDGEVQSHYLALWRRYGHVIDYVNFQFYAYDAGTTVGQFLSYYKTQSSNYGGGKVLASFISDGSGGLSPNGGFFSACNTLKTQGKLPGIFVWSADDSKSNGFRYERQSQRLLASSR